jgi:hypothetical protein
MIHGKKNESEQCDMSTVVPSRNIQSYDRVQTAASVTENKKPGETDILAVVLIVELTV